MYTLGHNFIPSPIHAGGLRYHGAGAIVSQLLKDGIIEANAINQIECFEAGILFSRTEAIIPAPEATHAIAEVIRQAKQADAEGVSKTILFNLCGHGHFDLGSYEQFLSGKLVDFEVSQEEINQSLAQLNTPTI
jgi:tryptophan synthase beta chain